MFTFLSFSISLGLDLCWGNETRLKMPHYPAPRLYFKIEALGK